MKEQTLKRRETVVDRLVFYTLVHLDGKLRERDLAEAMGFSQSYCCKAFKAVRGETIAKFIQQKRAERAASLYSLCSSTLNEIAVQSGYGTPEGVILAVNREYNCTPSVYRKSDYGNCVTLTSSGQVHGLEPGHAEVGVRMESGAFITYVYDSGQLAGVDTGNPSR